ncbi:MAG TPA: hypothetical protein VFE19_04165 [Jatrophihabitantaceae bacterium]|jgi:hypothetical protein|nr:hypothetical protein [Jatrophihabitantaceae bacterium]
MSDRQSPEAVAILRREFPQVPPRVITSVLAAYRPITPTVSDAVDAARTRILDARAV